MLSASLKYIWRQLSLIFYWRFIYISSEAELSFVNILSFIRWNGKYFLRSNWDVSPVLSPHCCVLYSDGLAQTIPILRWPRAGQEYISSKTKCLFYFWFGNGRNSITQDLKRCVHFEVRLIIVFICSLPTIIYFVHRKESGKLVLLVFAPPAAININIIIQTWPSNWTFKMQNLLNPVK